MSREVLPSVEIQAWAHRGRAISYQLHILVDQPSGLGLPLSFLSHSAYTRLSNILETSARMTLQVWENPVMSIYGEEMYKVHMSVMATGLMQLQAFIEGLFSPSVPVTLQH